MASGVRSDQLKRTITRFSLVTSTKCALAQKNAKQGVSQGNLLGTVNIASAASTRRLTTERSEVGRRHDYSFLLAPLNTRHFIQ